GRVRPGDLRGVLVQHQHLELPLVPHVVVQRGGPDPQLSGQSPDGDPLPALGLDQSPGRSKDLGPRGDRRTAGTRRLAGTPGPGLRHAPIIAPAVGAVPTGAATPVTGATHPVTCGRVTDSTPHRAARTNSLGWMPRSCYFRNMFHKSLQRTAV